MDLLSTFNKVRDDKRIYNINECKIKYWDQSLPCITCPEGKMSDTLENEVIDYYNLARSYNGGNSDGGSAILGGNVTRQLIGNKDKSDIDVVFYGLNRDQTYTLLNEICADLLIDSSYFTAATYTVILEDGWKIQFILAGYKDFNNIFKFVDVPSSAVLMDYKGDIWTSACAKLSLELGINWLNYTYVNNVDTSQPINNWSSTSWLRFAKYAAMGFDWVLPNLDLHKLTMFNMHSAFEILNIENYAIVCKWQNPELQMELNGNYSAPLEFLQRDTDYKLTKLNKNTSDVEFTKLFNRVYKDKVNRLFYPLLMTVGEFYGASFTNDVKSIKPVTYNFQVASNRYEPVDILHAHFYLTKGYIPDLIDDYHSMAFGYGIEVFSLINNNYEQPSDRDYNMLAELMKIKNSAFQRAFISNVLSYYDLSTIKNNTTAKFYDMFRKYLLDNYRFVSIGRNVDSKIQRFLNYY